MQHPFAVVALFFSSHEACWSFSLVSKQTNKQKFVFQFSKLSHIVNDKERAGWRPPLVIVMALVNSIGNVDSGLQCLFKLLGLLLTGSTGQRMASRNGLA